MTVTESFAKRYDARLYKIRYNSKLNFEGSTKNNDTHFELTTLDKNI